MRNQLPSLTLCVSLLFTSFSAPARAGMGLERLPEIAQSVEELSLRSEDQARARFLIQRHTNTYERPKACPLQSTRYQDILTRIQAIQTLFKESCLDEDSGRFDDILAGTATLREQLQALQNSGTDSEGTDDGDDASSSDAGDILSNLPFNIPGQSSLQLDGANLSGVIGNITSVFNNNKCNIDRGSFLEQSADLVQNLAQLGLLVPTVNGLAIAGGGMALASLLRLIDSLFDKRFDFSNVTDRQNFIKLNCAFWDVRRDIDASGFLDVPSREHREHQVEVADLLKEVQSKLKELEQHRTLFDRLLDAAKKEAVTQELGELENLKKSVADALKLIEKPIEAGAVPVQTQKLQVIQKLAELYPKLKGELEHYIALELASIPMLDSLLLVELRKLDHRSNPDAFMELLTMPLGDYNDSFRAGLLFHFGRINNDLQGLATRIENRWMEDTEVDGVKLSEIKKRFDDRYRQLHASLKTPVDGLTPVDTRLKRMIRDQQFTNSDDGTENIVNILDLYDEVTEQIYGEWGFKFLSYTTQESHSHNGEFKKLYRRFSRDHLTRNDEVPRVEDTPAMRVMFACQDGMQIRRRWRYAESLAQQGFDFVETNKELFHSDIPRVFLSTRGGRVGVHGFRSKFERIQAHHKSAVYANKIINGEDYDRDQADKYLRYRYLGNIMLGIHETRSDAGMVQDLIERFDCSRVLTQ
jgi:hypothetical protein